MDQPPQPPQPPQLPNAPFPAPPPFWRHFSPEKLSRLQAIKDRTAGADEIPPDLSYLEPPTPPTETYTAFGEEQTLSNDLPSLSSRGVSQLYPSDPTTMDPPTHLLQIIRFLHLNFQELTLILSQNPAMKDEKLEHIKNLFQNANWLVNMYRPHQARETLIAMMEEQIESGRREVEECETLEREASEVLRRVHAKGTGETGGKKFKFGGVDAVDGGSAGPTVHEENSRRVWKMMMEIDVEGR